MELYAVFLKGSQKRGGPEATTSFASLNIHHWLSMEWEAGIHGQ